MQRLLAFPILLTCILAIAQGNALDAPFPNAPIPRDRNASLFDDRPVDRLPPAWGVVRKLCTDGLTLDPGRPAMTVIGFSNVQISPKNKSIQLMFRRTFPAITGDFTAFLDLAWELPADRKFMGTANIHLIDARNATVALAGLSDGWIKAPARFAAAVGKQHLAKRLDVPDQKAETFRIERRNGIISIYAGTQLLFQAENTTPVTAIRLQLGQNLLFDQDGHNLSKFGRLEIHRIALDIP